MICNGHHNSDLTFNSKYHDRPNCFSSKSNQKGDWLMHLNIEGGIVSKKNDLEIMLHSSNIKIVCLNEHWLNDDSIFILNSIPNYNLAHFYCRTASTRGGSCILLQKDLEYKVRDDLCAFNEESVFEASCIEVLTLKIN